MTYRRISIIAILAISVLALLLAAVKGSVNSLGSLGYQTERDGRVGGPFESSNNTSRYMLTEAIAEDNSIVLSPQRASFASPDIVQKGEQLYSIFPPGVSFIGAPFYLIGKWLGAPQLVAYLSTVLFALVNIFLVALLGKRLGASSLAAFVGGLVFGFATNALPYALTYTQHHASTTVILAALLLALSAKTVFRSVFFGLLYAGSLLLDIPNALFLLPIALYAVWRHVSTRFDGGCLHISLKLSVLALLIGLLPMLGVFGWYNHELSGSWTSIAQGLTRVKILENGEIHKTTTAQIDDPYQSRLFFDSRFQANGFYILLLSNERGWLFYSPIVLLGIIGLIFTNKKNELRDASVLSSTVVLVILVAYSMFGDPWGGWSFGPRYLIPAAAILCAALGAAISRYNKKPAFVVLFIILAAYSVAVNVLGALTTNSVPPKDEAINLSQPIPYTYTYNLRFIDANKTSSLVYNIYFNRYLSARDFAILYWLLAFATISGLFAFTMREKETGGINL